MHKPSITKAQFDQIKEGMSRNEVTAIVGDPGQVQFETGTGKAYGALYSYWGDGSANSIATMLFQAGILIKKHERNLQ